MIDGIVDTVVHRVCKAFTDNSNGASPSNEASSSSNFACIIANSLSFSAISGSINTASLYWIVDTWASDHMISDINLLHYVQKLSKPILVVLE